MITADVIAIILMLAFFFGGIILGFGKTLKLLTSGLVGKIISVVVCYFLFGVVLYIPFVQSLLDKMIFALKENGNFICKVLLFIRLDLIVFAVSLFIFVQLLRRWAVGLIKSFFEIDTKPMRIINMVLGAALGLIALVIFTLVIFQVIAWIGGTEGEFYQSLSGSVFKLDEIFKNNPVNSIFKTIIKSFKTE